MAKTLNLGSPIRVITSGTAPTTTNMKKGELAYGTVGGVNRLYGNPTGKEIMELASLANVSGAAIATGRKWTDGRDIYQKSFDVSLASRSQMSLSSDGVGTGNLLAVVPELTSLMYGDGSGGVDIMNKNTSGAVYLINPATTGGSASTAALRNDTAVAIRGVLTVYFTRT